jgi:tetratricopeptide (TPR) repeat protein
MRLTPDGATKAIELFERAVAADPRLARAWSDLAAAQRAAVTYGADAAITYPAALAAARRAIEIDPSDASGHAMLGMILGLQGDLGPAEAEFDTALRLNPGDAGILAGYASWAVAFGHPERAAEFADRAVRLNPDYHVWDAYNFSYAYFSTGRYEDTLRILERLPRDQYLYYSWVLRAASYAGLGQPAKAKAATSEALAHYPELTAEGFTGTPDWSDAERKRLTETMRAAGFPMCAKPETLAHNSNLVRLPECLPK